MNDPWQLVDEWQLEEGPDGEIEESTFVPVIKPAIPIEEVNSLNDASLETLTCVICGKQFDTKGILRVCTPCWDELKTMPKVYLHLVDSEKYDQGVVTWDHGNIGSQPHDPSAVPIGIWGKYGAEGEKLTYWVSLCKPVEAIHDMMTQFQAAVSERAALFKAQIRYADNTLDNSGTGYKFTKTVRRSAPTAPKPIPPVVPVSAADKLKNFLGR
jgi:hypothetical protein